MKKMTLTNMMLVVAVNFLFASTAFADEQTFDACVGYFSTAPIWKSITGLALLILMVVFSVTKKSMPGLLKKAWDIAAGLLKGKK